MYRWQPGNAPAVSAKKVAVNRKNVKNVAKKGSSQRLNKGRTNNAFRGLSIQALESIFIALTERRGKAGYHAYPAELSFISS